MRPVKLPTSKKPFAKGGETKHDDEAEDKALIKRMVKKEDLKPGMAKGGKWIQSAIKKPGALRAQLGVKKGEPIPDKKLAAAAKKPGKLGQRARFAQTLKGMKK